MAMTDILKQINAAEAEAENIVAEAKTKIADIEKETAVKIDRINETADAEIAAAAKAMTPKTTAHNTDAGLSVSDAKIAKAIEFGTKEFFARVSI